MMSGNQGDENIFFWIGTIVGGKRAPYDGLSYIVYPFKPPQVKFETLCFHPNVDQHGHTCLDILQDMWRRKKKGEEKGGEFLEILKI